MFCVVVGLLVLACGKPETNRTAVVSGEQLGVPECDNFLNAYENCVSNNVPEEQRPKFQSIMANWRSDWKKHAADPQTRPGLIVACKNHLELARSQMKAYGCTF